MNIQQKSNEEMFWLDIVPLRQWIFAVVKPVSSELFYVLSKIDSMVKDDVMDMNFFSCLAQQNPAVYQEYLSLLSMYKKEEANEHKNSLLLAKRISKIKHFFLEDTPVGPEFLSILLNENVHGRTYEQYCAMLYDLIDKEPKSFLLLEQALMIDYPHRKNVMENYITGLYMYDMNNPYIFGVSLLELLQEDLPLHILNMQDGQKKTLIMYRFLLTMDLTTEFRQRAMNVKSYIRGDTLPAAPRRLSISGILPDNKQQSSGGDIGYPTQRPGLDYYDNRRERFESGELVEYKGQFMPTKAYDSIEYAQYLLDHQED